MFSFSDCLVADQMMMQEYFDVLQTPKLNLYSTKTGTGTYINTKNQKHRKT